MMISNRSICLMELLQYNREQEADRNKGSFAMKVKKTLAALLGIILAIIFLVLSVCGLLFWSAGNLLCDSQIFQEIYSPNGKYKVLVFQRDCGATTGFRTHISVLKSNVTLRNQTGNVFQANGYPEWFSIRITWEDDQHVVIEHNGKPIPDISKSKFGNIEVRYIENREGIMPPRSFKPSNLLLPANLFPIGWTAKEERPFGPEEIKGSKENNPYMLYTPPPPAKYFEAGHYVSRLDNIEESIEAFKAELKVLNKNYSENCRPQNGSSSDELIFKSEYSQNYAVGYAKHYPDGSGEPMCTMIAQYDEFFIKFTATISESGLTYEQFNVLVKKIDEIMMQHLQ